MSHPAKRGDAPVPFDRPALPSTQHLLDHIRGGLTRERAFEAFLNACGREDTRSRSDEALNFLGEHLLRALPLVVTEDHASMLRELACNKTRFEDVLIWLEEPGMPWEEFWRERAECDALDLLEPKGEILVPWSDIEAARRKRKRKGEPDSEPLQDEDLACPECGAKPVCVEINSPVWTWAMLCGRSWSVLICDSCHLQIKLNLGRIS